jgi:oligopeptide/dipeptide ABC transporter ATP-binding protein
MADLLRIEDVEIAFKLREGMLFAVNGVSLRIPAGRVVALVGESGCGKTVLAKSVLQLLPPLARVSRGRILLAPERAGEKEIDIAALPLNGSAIRRIRGKRISMIFQEPMASLSPVHTIGEQIAEVVRLHEGLRGRAAMAKAIEILRLARVPAPERRVRSYSHELSGGLRQRAMIAMALACRPELVIADEPTTALDVTIQAQILALLRDLQQSLGMAVLIITHDLGVVAQIADEVAVMYMGRIVERAVVAELFARPRHPYTRGLLDSVPRLGEGSSTRLVSIPGSVPPPFANVDGCPFHPRCPHAVAGVCDVTVPRELAVGDSAAVACHLYDEALAGVMSAAAKEART